MKNVSKIKTYSFTIFGLSFYIVMFIVVASLYLSIFYFLGLMNEAVEKGLFSSNDSLYEKTKNVDIGMSFMFFGIKIIVKGIIEGFCIENPSLVFELCYLTKSYCSGDSEKFHLLSLCFKY